MKFALSYFLCVLVACNVSRPAHCETYPVVATLKLGFEKPGVRVSLVLRSHVVPKMAGEALELQTRKSSRLMSKFTELQGLVHIANADDALRYVRLDTATTVTD